MAGTSKLIPILGKSGSASLQLHSPASSHRESCNDTAISEKGPESWNEFEGFEAYVDEFVVGEFINVKPRRVLELARAGELPAHPLGRVRKTWRFRLSEIESHLSAQHQSATVKMPVAVPRTKERNRLG